jgi:hypothetical protein
LGIARSAVALAGPPGGTEVTVFWLLTRPAPPLAGPEAQAIRDRLARIGVGPGRTFEFEDLSLERKAEVLLGMRAGEMKVEAEVGRIGTTVNGWVAGSAFGDRAFYDGDWL